MHQRQVIQGLYILYHPVTDGWPGLKYDFPPFDDDEFINERVVNIATVRASF